MESADLVKQVRAMYEGFSLGDLEAYRRAFSDEIVWHVPGDNPVSGVYSGAKEYFEDMPSKMAPLDDWRFQVKDVMVNARDRAALVHLHLNGSRKGKTVDMDGYHMVRLDDQGRVREGWGFVNDQQALDDFFSA